MRNIIVLATLLLSLGLSGQSKKETIDWINSKFPKNPIIYDDNFPHSSSMKINQDGTFTITKSYYKYPISNPPQITTVLTIKGNLKDFNPKSVQTLSENNEVFIIIDCYNSSDCISVSKVGSGGFSNSKKGVTFGAFSGFELDIDKRLVKAFKHLIVLCGGKDETF